MMSFTAQKKIFSLIKFYQYIYTYIVRTQYMYLYTSILEAISIKFTYDLSDNEDIKSRVAETSHTRIPAMQHLLLTRN